MSTRIKRLSFEMLYCKGKSKNEEFRKLVSNGKRQDNLCPAFSLLNLHERFTS
jgi:hypothetical protein